MAELSTSKVLNFNLTLCDGVAVVRNQNRINGLLGVRAKDIPSQYHNLLAKANFTGSVVNETIIWTTSIFNSSPSRLSELPSSEQVKYKEILNNALAAYAKTIANAEPGVKKLLYAAITYPSDSAVFCADERVVITEWGMAPVDSPSLLGMPYSIDDKDKKRNNPEDRSAEDSDNEDRHDDTDSYKDDADTGNESDTSNLQDNNIVAHDNSNSEHSESEDNVVSGKDTSENNINNVIPPPPVVKKKPWWKWWWIWFILLLLLLLLLFLLLRVNKNNPAVIPVTPDLGKDDVVLSDDSLRYVANNRLLLLLTGDGADIEAFSKDFRTKYPDNKKYVLSNPDTIIGRLTLTLPSDERAAMTESLPIDFSSYGLVVIPETMYRNNGSIPNDPALNEQDKRWYFDECSVFDAWDVTNGDKDIVVAVIDDGFDLDHPELKGKIVKPFNAVTHTNQIFPSASGHGTHVAATAVGNAGNNNGIAGIAPGCKLMPIQVGDANGNMSTSAILDAVIYAIENGADVVNMSLGMSFGPFVQFAPLYVQKNFRANMFLEEQRVWDYLFDIARQRGVTFVLAGGNENALIGLDPMQRSPNTLKVSATQPDRSKAKFSNYGDMSTVSAPGVHIYNAVPGGRYTFMDGTSMASPIVAGGVALLKSKDKTLSVKEIAEILRTTGNPSGSDVGPVVNFARALNAEYASPSQECAEINSRYQELLSELERLKRDHPECIQTPDTLSLPKHFTPKDLTGRWQSTTKLINQQNEQVVIYFTFNGTPNGRIDIVEPSGTVYSAALDVNVANDIVNINQQSPAISSAGRQYNPYSFVIRPDRNRKASGKAKNKIESANMFDFNLIRI